MDSTGTKKTIIVAILISLCIFSIFFSLSLFRHFKTAETKFNNEKASLIKENISLQDQLESIKKDIKVKTDAVTVLESEKKSLLDQIKSTEEDSKKLDKRYAELYGGRIGALKKENSSLRNRMLNIGKAPLADFIKNYMGKEENENIKKVLAEALRKVELIQTGKVVNLEPIVVAENNAQATTEPASSLGNVAGKAGKIISIDRDNNLIVVDLGRADDVKAGQRCMVMHGDKEIGSGEIISTRYKMSAAFINDIKYKYTFSDIKESDKVLIGE